MMFCEGGRNKVGTEMKILTRERMRLHCLETAYGRTINPCLKRSLILEFGLLAKRKITLSLHIEHAVGEISANCIFVPLLPSCAEVVVVSFPKRRNDPHSCEVESLVYAGHHFRNGAGKPCSSIGQCERGCRRRTKLPVLSGTLC
jgi:hypothetical protein